MKDIGQNFQRRWWLLGGKTAPRMRAKYLLDKMFVAEVKIEELERKNNELKKVLVQSIDGGAARKR